MGQRSLRLRQFFELNPYCVFCGGGALATTEDHQPARALFEDRIWPEGYVFPACEACNQDSKHYEHIWALLVRISLGEAPPDFLKYASAMLNNFPNLLRFFSTNQMRRFFKEHGLVRSPGTSFSDIAMAQIDADSSTLIMKTVLHKIMKALHYKHTGRIVPSSGAIQAVWFTNATAHQIDEFAQYNFTNALPVRPPIIRNKQDLSAQFSYRFGLNEIDRVTGYALTFRQSVIAFGVVAESISGCRDTRAEQTDPEP